MNAFAPLTAVSALARMYSAILAAHLVGFAVIILTNPDSLQLAGRTYLYTYLLRVASPATWGTISATVGLIRLVALALGSLTPRSHLFNGVRVITAAYGAVFWVQIMVGAYGGPVIVPAVSVFTAFFVLELLNTHNAVIEFFIKPQG